MRRKWLRIALAMLLGLLLFHCGPAVEQQEAEPETLTDADIEHRTLPPTTVPPVADTTPPVAPVPPPAPVVAPPPASGIDRYRQTWQKNYSDTACSEWHQEMTSPQRFAAAADMLVGARSVDGGKGLPADSVINQFAGDIGEACEAGDVLPLNEIAVGIYVIGKQTYGP